MSSTSSTKKSSSKTGLIIGIAALIGFILVIAIGFAIYWFFIRDNGDDPVDTGLVGEEKVFHLNFNTSNYMDTSGTDDPTLSSGLTGPNVYNAFQTENKKYAVTITEHGYVFVLEKTEGSKYKIKQILNEFNTPGYITPMTLTLNEPNAISTTTVARINFSARQFGTTTDPIVVRRSNGQTITNASHNYRFYLRESDGQPLIRIYQNNDFTDSVEEFSVTGFPN